MQGLIEEKKSIENKKLFKRICNDPKFLFKWNSPLLDVEKKEERYFTAS